MLIAHVSDAHLCAPGELYQGLVDSNAMFAVAVRNLNELDPAPDLVLFTGDLVEHGTPAEYAFARELLNDLRAPLLAIPGNHDDRDAFRSVFRDQPYWAESGPLHFTVDDCGPVRIIALDATVPGAHHGEADQAACDWLDTALRPRGGDPAIVMLHHPPFESGIGFIDAYRCFGGDRLAAVLARHQNVERVLCGHIHRAVQVKFGGTLAMTAPSTATAIALRLAAKAKPASYLEPPAMLLHQWRPGVGTITHLLPIGDFSGPMHFF